MAIPATQIRRGMVILFEGNARSIGSFEIVARNGKLPRIESFMMGEMAGAPSRGQSSTWVFGSRRSPSIAGCVPYVNIIDFSGSATHKKIAD